MKSLPVFLGRSSAIRWASGKVPENVLPDCEKAEGSDCDSPSADQGPSIFGKIDRMLIPLPKQAIYIRSI